jgi:hypothetical protein
MPDILASRPNIVEERAIQRQHGNRNSSERLPWPAALVVIGSMSVTLWVVIFHLVEWLGH